ncbi:hypothetical protein [Paenibacillus sp. B2(2019)]|uniref:hypothetical protein n=1 Tax=Paenibacillus sp. B2(2019) TaxID=2607754 RepID=UPI001CB70C63|nr:hypothetical protein [Paenibacillus sp. B2(2019)]
MEKLIKGEGDGGGFRNWRSVSVRICLQISTTNSGLKSRNLKTRAGGSPNIHRCYKVD